jgi:acyl-CoA dehydrogenase
MDFLKPSPHGGIRLDRAWAPAENRLGAIGNAYQAMIRPFRMMEDAVLLGPLAGALARLAWCCGREAPPGDLPDEPARALARVWAASKSAGLMAREAALRLDQGANPEAIEPFCWVGRDMAEAAAGLVNSFYAGLGMEPGYESVRLLKDVARTATLAGHAIHLGQAKRGRNLMVRFRTEEEQAESA